MARFPTRVDRTTFNALAVSPYTVTLPGSIVAGQLLVIHVFRRGGSQTFTLPSGYNLVANSSALLGSLLQYACYTRIADGSEGATFTLSSSVATSARIHVHVDRYNNADTAGTPVIFESTSHAATGTAPDPPSFNPGVALDYLWGALTFSDNASGSAITSYPTNYTVNQASTTGTSSTTGVETYMAFRELNASSEDPGAFTCTGSVARVAKTFAIKGRPYTDQLTATKVAADVLITDGIVKARISKAAADVLITSGAPKVRVTKQVVEVVISLSDLPVTATGYSFGYIL